MCWKESHLILQSTLQMTPLSDGNGLIRVAVFCGGATQTALWADGIQQQFVQRWLLQQTLNSGDGRDFSFLSSRLDLASLKSSRKPPVRSDRPTQNHQRDSNKPKKPQRGQRNAASFGFTFHSADKWSKQTQI